MNCVPAICLWLVFAASAPGQQSIPLQTKLPDTSVDSIAAHPAQAGLHDLKVGRLIVERETRQVRIVFNSLPAEDESRVESDVSESILDDGTSRNKESRESNAANSEPRSGAAGQIKMPRLMAPISDVQWLLNPSRASLESVGVKGKSDAAGQAGKEPENGLSPPQFKPLVDGWLFSWSNLPSNATGILVQLGAKPLLAEELPPIESQVDGSFWLPAHLALPTGEKLRYEPQPHKNTVGYWTEASDSVTWRFQLDEPGEFNVAILQGCGKGHGGSRGRLSVSAAEPLEFTVLETGHFQNFRWRHLGHITLQRSGVHELRIEPLEIANAALMDVRSVNLIRLPER